MAPFGKEVLAGTTSSSRLGATLVYLVPYFVDFVLCVLLTSCYVYLADFVLRIYLADFVLQLVDFVLLTLPLLMYLLVFY